MTESAPFILPDRWTVIRRGLCERCPKCGVGKLFVSYLKPVQACAACGEDFSAIRADDGPAWLTIMVTGHLAVPVAIYVSMHDLMPAWAGLTLLLALTVLAVMAILPRSKGVFIGMIWLLKQRKSEPDRRFDHITQIP